MKMPVLLISLSVISTAAYSKACDELKTEIAAKIDANHVTGYTLEIVAKDEVGERKVVGSCESGARKIVYDRHAGAPAKAGAASADTDKK